MSHTIGQVEQDNPQSDADALQDLKNLEEQASEEARNLADKDYEFLFNQLLEGISHGWHDQRIIKFFEQLGDRGTQEDWVAWLERLRPKVLTLPIQSKRQLGTMMIRLGELTRSTEQISKIGATSNRLGRELLFGDAGDIIWEYAGPDLIENVVNTAIREGEETSPSLAVKIETEEEISNRLPAEFNALSSLTAKETTEASPEPTTEMDEVDNSSSATGTPVANSNVVKDEDLQESPPTTEQPLTNTEFDQDDKIGSEETVLNSEEFEFELSELTSAPVAKETIEVKIDRDSTPTFHPLKSITNTEQKPELIESLKESTSNFQPQETVTNTEQKSELLEEIVESLKESTSNFQPQETVTNTEQKSELLEEIVESLKESTSISQPQETVTNSEQKSELLEEIVESLKESTSISQPQETVTNSEQKSELLEELVESLKESTSISQPQEGDLSARELLSPITEQNSSKSVSLRQLMSLIQQDEELALAISQKLNISRDKLAIETSALTSAEQQDSSSLELIESWFNLGLKQVSAGEFTRAIASWEKALKINPNLSEAWHNRGSALGRLGKYSEAVESFQNALAIDADNYQAWNDYAHALYQLQQWAEAVRGWNNALKITPANHLFWYNRGCALEQLEEWAEAIVSHEKSLEIKPDFQPARSRYINLVADNPHPN